MQIKRKPEWLKVKLPASREFTHVKGILSHFHLHSICQEARCPNVTECFHSGTATFLILGNICTRSCRYCTVAHGKPGGVDIHEPERLAKAVRELGLQYVVITSVTRDDLSDGGAEIFVQCVEAIYREIPGCRVEVLIPDLQGNWEALRCIISAQPYVINHNMEVVPALFDDVRPQGNYHLSLELLRRVYRYGNRNIMSKSGFMVGLGESWDEVMGLLHDLASVHCEMLAVGQYQQPTRNHWPVVKYYHPDEFEEIKRMAYEMGIKHVESGPLVRSSYHAADILTAPTFGKKQ